MKIEQESFHSQWRDVADHILPTRPRFLTSDANRGDRKNYKIYDNTATIAARNLRSGLMGGLTSPARPWFQLSTPVPELNENGAVKQWLDDVTKRMRTVLIKSNLYNVLPLVFGDIGTFATGGVYMEEDFDSVVRFFSLPIGSYYIGVDHLGRVNKYAREFRMTVHQIVMKFGYDREKNEIDWSGISESVKNLYESGHTEQWIDVSHVIKPNHEYKPNSPLSKHKLYKSVYYESSRGNVDDSSSYSGELLSDKGYDYFPVLAPRWEVTGEDVYGTNCPGFEAIGDTRQLQTGEKRLLQAIEKSINPPMLGPTSLKQKKASTIPGDITYYDIREGQQGFRPVYEINPRINEMELKQQQVRQRISKAYFEDLFLMMANSTRRQITAREIDERHEEKLLALGPVLEQLNQDLLDPLIDNTFDIMLRQQMLPLPPEEIQGIELKVEYTSIMAQAQKLSGLAGVDRFTQYVGQVAQVDPRILDKVNADQLIDVYGEITSIDPQVINDDKVVEKVRQDRAKQQQQQAMMEQIKQGAGAARDLGQAEDGQLGELLRVAQAGSTQPQ
jgi:hypothetical protein